MIEKLPHVMLLTQAQRQDCDGRENAGTWRFMLTSGDGRLHLEAGDREWGHSHERLQLLAVVRGLEALDSPSKVTLVTASRYVRRGLRLGLEAWRSQGWCWERFGVMTQIRNADLWQRVDQALKFHRLHCKTWRFDTSPHPTLAGPHFRRQRQRNSAARENQLVAAS